ncbi:MAG: chemotaxis protein CheW [Candidatus Polarisedimenticolia bacterium]
MREPILTFAARSEWYGLAAQEVREVARVGSVRPVPRAPGLVAGLAEVHGRIVTLIDLDRLIPADGARHPAEAPAAGSGIGPFGIVLAPPLDHLGILVRSEVDVAAWPEETATPPESGRGGWLRARLPVGERLLNLIALPELVERLEQAIRAGFVPGGGTAGGEA